MEHQFNVEVAKVYGVEESILIHNIFFWIKKNVANDKHKHDGRYWTYNSSKAFAELFPYFNEKKISRLLAKMCKDNILVKGNFNQTAFDRTLWYSLSDETLSVLDKEKYDISQMSKSYDDKRTFHFSKMENGFSESEEPIPDSNTDSKQNKEEIDKSISKKDDNLPFAAETQEGYDDKPKKKRKVTPKNDQLFEECWKAYNRKGNKGKAKPYWDKLTEEEKCMVLPHIKAYTKVRERSYQADFMRYLRDKTFNDVVYKGNSVLYDPDIANDNEGYHPSTNGTTFVWNETLNCYMYVGNINNFFDGYTNENRPNGAQFKSFGYTYTWNANTKSWDKE